MSETTYRDPFAEENQTTGESKFGWNEKGVLIQAATYTNKTGQFGDYAQLEITGLADGDDEPRTQFFPGDKNVTASEDGETLLLGEGKLGKNTPLAQFGVGVKKFDAKLAAKMGPKASALVGYKLHFREIEQLDQHGKPKMRDGKDKQGNPRKYPKTVPVPQSMISAPKGAVDAGTETDAARAIKEVISANQGKVEKAKLSVLLAKHLNGHAQKQTILTLAADNKFLKAIEGVTYDGLTLSL